jgi:hypothetical protein
MQKGSKKVCRVEKLPNKNVRSYGKKGEQCIYHKESKTDVRSNARYGKKAGRH